MKTTTTYTPAQLSDILNKGITESYQKEANTNFVTQLGDMVAEGGTWAWPDAGRVFTHVGDNWQETV